MVRRQYKPAVYLQETMDGAKIVASRRQATKWLYEADGQTVLKAWLDEKYRDLDFDKYKVVLEDDANAVEVLWRMSED